MQSSGRFVSPWHELHHLDFLLAQLSRPDVPGAALSPLVSAQLRALGLSLDDGPQRQELVERVWDRKRPLLRELRASDDPPPACA